MALYVNVNNVNDVNILRYSKIKKDMKQDNTQNKENIQSKKILLVTFTLDIPRENKTITYKYYHLIEQRPKGRQWSYKYPGSWLVTVDYIEWDSSSSITEVIKDSLPLPSNYLWIVDSILQTNSIDVRTINYINSRNKDLYNQMYDYRKRIEDERKTL